MENFDEKNIACAQKKKADFCTKVRKIEVAKPMKTIKYDFS